jgi:branched-chain amino acid transport system substrate-binding protein
MRLEGIGRIAGMLVAIILGVSLGWLMPLSAQGAEKPTEFVIYQSHDLSGPMGPLMVAAIPGSYDYCEWFNKTKGGIKGVPIKSVLLDNAGKVGQGISAYETFRLKVPKPPIVLITPTFVAQALRDRTFQDQIVEFFDGGSNSALFPVKFTIGMSNHYAGAAAGSLAWARKRWPGKEMKVGMLTWDNAFGKGIVDDQLKKWIKSQPNISLVGVELFKPRDVDVTTQVIRLKNKGANWIVDNTLGNGPVTISKTLKNLGLLSQDIKDATPGKIHRICGPWGMSDDVIRLGGGKKGLMEGAIGTRYLASFAEKDNPGIKLLLKSLKEHKRGANVKTMYYAHIWAKLDVVTHVVGKIVEKDGWKGLTGKAVWNGLTHLKNYNALGLADVTFSPDYPVLNKGKVFMVKGGEILPVSGYEILPNMTPGLRK